MATTYNNLYLDLRTELRRAGDEEATQSARELVCAAAAKTREELVRDGSVSKREFDVTLAANAQSTASVAQAKANLEIARQDLQTVIVNRGSLEAAVASAERKHEAVASDGVGTNLGGLLDRFLLGIAYPRQLRDDVIKVSGCNTHGFPPDCVKVSLCLCGGG